MVKYSVVAEQTLYHVIVFWVFFAVYRAIGFDQTNFTFVNNRMNHEDNDLATTLWYTVTNHIHMGAADVLPTSALARMFTALHVVVVFVLLAGILVLTPGPPSSGLTAATFAS